MLAGGTNLKLKQEQKKLVLFRGKNWAVQNIFMNREPLL